MSLPACAADAIPNQRANVSRDAGPYTARWRRTTSAIAGRAAAGVQSGSSQRSGRVKRTFGPCGGANTTSPRNAASLGIVPKLPRTASPSRSLPSASATASASSSRVSGSPSSASRIASSTATASALVMPNALRQLAIS